MSRAPEISVIVPVFNEIENLPHCLNALRAQTLPDECYEVLVVDNGSTDGSFEAARRYTGVRAIQDLQPNAYLCRNTGIRATRGDIVVFTAATARQRPAGSRTSARRSATTALTSSSAG